MGAESAVAKARPDLERDAWPGTEAAFASLDRIRWPQTLARMKEQTPDLRQAFKAAEPFPHVVIDGLFDDDLLDAIAAEFPGPEDPQWRASTSPDGAVNPWGPTADLAGPLIHILTQRMNSQPFIDCLAAITGIRVLIGGSQPTLQQSQQGNRLAAHVDGMKTARTGLYLRLTTMLFLDRDWAESYVGDFELWNEDASACVRPIAPLFNRFVIFVNSDKSYHGFPQPMQAPDGARRRSILLRYHTARRPDGTGMAPDKRNFGPSDLPPERPRIDPPQSHWFRNTVRQIAPPILLDLFRKMR